MDQMKAQLLLELKKSQEKKSSILCRQDYAHSPSLSESGSSKSVRAGADLQSLVENDVDMDEEVDPRTVIPSPYVNPSFEKTKSAEIAVQPTKSAAGKTAAEPTESVDQRTKSEKNVVAKPVETAVIEKRERTATREPVAAVASEHHSILVENHGAEIPAGSKDTEVTPLAKKGLLKQDRKNKDLEAIKANRVTKEKTPGKTPVTSARKSEPNNVAPTANPVLNQVLGLGKSASKSKKATSNVSSDNFLEFFDRQLAASFVCEMEEPATPVNTLTNGDSKIVKVTPQKKEASLQLVNLFGEDEKRTEPKKKNKNGGVSTRVKSQDGTPKVTKPKSGITAKHVHDMTTTTKSRCSNPNSVADGILSGPSGEASPVVLKAQSLQANKGEGNTKKRKVASKFDPSTPEGSGKSSGPQTQSEAMDMKTTTVNESSVPPRKRVKVEPLPEDGSDTMKVSLSSLSSTPSSEKQAKAVTPRISVKSFAATDEVQKKKKKDVKKSIFPDPEASVVCNGCNQVLIAKTFLEHNYEEHNMLAWVTGIEKPSIKEQLQEFKFDSYVCKKCGTVYSFNAYAGHVTNCDWDSENWCYTSKKGKTVKGVPAFLASGAVVKCNSCDALVVGTAFLKHNYENHNMLAWPCGDYPKISVPQQLKLLGFVSFSCSLCGAQFSPKAYAAHVLSCGTVAANASLAVLKTFPDHTEMVTCTGCNGIMVASRFLGHNYEEHNMLEWVQDKPKRPTIQEMLEDYRFEKYSCKNCKKICEFNDFANHVENCRNELISPKLVNKTQEPIFPDPGLEVTCSECEFKMPASEFLQHNFEEHNMLSWVEELEKRPTIVQMLKEFKFPDYTCKECYKEFGAAAFAVHVINCKGKEKEPATECNMCSRRFAADEFHVHNYREHGMLAKKKGSRYRMNSVAVWKILQRRRVPLQCPRCLQSFSDIPSIKTHEQTCPHGHFVSETSGTPKKPRSKKQPQMASSEKIGDESGIELLSVTGELSDSAKQEISKGRKRSVVTKEILEFPDCFSQENIVTCSQCSQRTPGNDYLTHAYEKHNLRCVVKEYKGDHHPYRDLADILNLSVYTCCICHSTFNKEEYLEHITLCLAPGDVECNMCDVRITKNDFWFHSYFAHGLLARARGSENQKPTHAIWQSLISMGIPLQCPRCSKTVTSISGIAFHDKTCGHEKVRCPYCLRKYIDIQSHIEERHPERVPPASSKKKSGQKAGTGYTQEPSGMFSCMQCEFVTIDVAVMNSHLHENHVDLIDLEDGSDPEFSVVDEEKSERDESGTPGKKKKGKSENISSGKKPKKGRALKFADFIDSDMHVTCSVCYLVLPGRYFLDHVYRKHNFRGWVVDYIGEKPTIPEMIDASKIVSFKCSICDKTYNKTDFYSHIINCVREGDKECNACHKRIMEEDFHFHNYYKHALLARIVGEENQKISYVIWNKLLSWGVPMQCPRCSKTFTTEAGCVAHDKNCGKQKVMCHLCCKEFKDIDCHMKTAHPDPASLPSDGPRDKRKSATKAMKSFKSYEEDERGFRCKVCDSKADSVEEIEKHISREHGGVTEVLDDHSDAAESLESEDEGDHEIEVKAERLPKVKAIEADKVQTTAQSSTTPIDLSNMLVWLSHTSRPVQSLKMANDRMIQFSKENFTQEPLFPELVPDPSEWVNGDTLDSYRIEPIPVYISSLKESRMIDAFTSEGDIVFCGDLVTDLAWCPDSDYLAVATESSIQIWDTRDNSFKYSVVHTTEHINAIEWCPSGGASPGSIPRLGLLAVAAGCVVNILALPDPSSVGQDRVYHITPNLILSIPGKPVECTCFSWFSGSGHRKLAAGFADGTVAVWNIAVRSSLTSFGNLMFPIFSFLAHNAIVCSVSFCSEFDGRYLASCGMDKHTYVWDLNEVRTHNTPLIIHKTALCMKVEWATHWPHLVLTGDFALNDRRSTYVVDVGLSGKLIHIVTQGSSAFAAKVNPWYDVIVHGTESGEVICAPLGNPNKDDRYIKPGTIRITEFGLNQENTHFIVNDKPSHFYFRQEDCRPFPLKERDQGIQQICALAWGTSPTNNTLLAVGSVGGVLQILDAKDVFNKMKQTKRHQ